MIATSAPRAEEQYKKRGPADRSSLFMACALPLFKRNIPAPKGAEHPLGAMRDCNLHRLLI